MLNVVDYHHQLYCPLAPQSSHRAQPERSISPILFRAPLTHVIDVATCVRNALATSVVLSASSITQYARTVTESGKETKSIHTILR
jgi:hypothetical protein